MFSRAINRPHLPSIIVSLKPPSSTKIAGVPIEKASIGVKPNGSLWAMLTMARASDITFANSDEESLGAIHNCTELIFACFCNWAFSASVPPPTWARAIPVPESIEMVSIVALAQLAVPTVTTYSACVVCFIGLIVSPTSFEYSSWSTHGCKIPHSMPYTSLER